MERTVQQITQKLIDLLPDNEQHYRLDELREWGFPGFVVRRIGIELERNLAESMVLPKTDWANIESEAVQQAWQQFVEAIRAEARLPASYAKAVIETAVADVMDILIQPRKNIPDILFGADEKYLDYEQVSSRVDSLVVYPHFSKIILRYMQKKDVKRLPREKCRQVISAADEKMTNRYTPLNWAQLLEPLFRLLDGKIDTNLLRLFFEDKNIPHVARRFDLMNSTVSRAELIEILSSPELLNMEGYEDEQSSLFEKLKSYEQDAFHEKRKRNAADNREESDGPQDESANEEANKSETKNPGAVEKESANSPEETETPEEEKNPGGEKSDGTTEAEEDTSLNAVFGKSGEDDEDYEKDAGPVEVSEEMDTEADSLNRIFAEEEQPEEELSEPDFRKEESAADIDSADEVTEDANTDEEMTVDPQSQENSETSPEITRASEETPMWKRFLSPEQMAELESREGEEDTGYVDEGDNAEEQEYPDNEPVDEDGYIDEPVIDLTKDEQESNQESVREKKKLSEQLSQDREMFIEEIFRGSERAFDEALEHISGYDDWQSASKYIEKDIFKRNMVDMYSEAAVDFTDCLQTYFLEKQNRN